MNEYSPYNAVLIRSIPVEGRATQTITYRIGVGETVESVMNWANRLTECSNAIMIPLEITQTHRKPKD